MRARTALVLIAALLTCTGCGNDLSGTWVDEAGVTTYTFARNGVVTISVLGADVSAEYRLDGDKVLVSSAQGTVVLTRREEHLYGPMGLELVRQTE